MDNLIKSIIKTFSALFLVFLCTMNLQAKESDYTETKAPPVVTLQVDTIPLIKLSNDVHDSVSVYEAVEDTVLPPCDIIFFKSGKLEYCKITETTATTVSYKMCDYLDGPTIIANKSTIQKIRYANGKEELVTAEQIIEKSNKNAYTAPRKDPLARLSFLFGIISVSIALVLGFAFVPLALAGLILGVISLIKMRRRKGEFRGKGAAIVGIILCAVVLLLVI